MNRMFYRCLISAALAACLLPFAGAPAFSGVQQKDWTVMVYVNGKNDLEAAALADVNEMEKAGSTDRVNIVVELGRAKRFDASDGDWAGARRYLVKKDADPGKIASPVLAEFPKVDMGDWRHLAEFGKWAKASYPARRYLFIVWNHGNGWYKGAASAATKAISLDSETGSQVYTWQLGQALAGTGKVDIYGSDACLMQMAEVAFELREHADFILGSEESVPGEGFPYDKLLQALVDEPGISPENLGIKAVEAYAAFYQEPRTAAISLLRASKLPELARRLDAWTYAVVSQEEKENMTAAQRGVLRFYNGNMNDSADLHMLVKLVGGGTKNPKLADESRSLMNFIERDLVVLSRASGQDREARGIAVYLPTNYYDTDYDRLAWAKAANWAGFANWAFKLIAPPYKTLRD